MTRFKKVGFETANQSAFGVLQADHRTPILQGDFAYGLNTQIWQQTYTFTVTDPGTDPVAGDVYSVNNAYFTVIYVNATTMICYGTAAPSASGNLTRVTGAGTTPIAYSAYTQQSGFTFGTGASVDTNSSRLRIQSGTSATSFAFITSRRPIKYRAGQGTDFLITPLFTAPATDNTQLWGIGTMSGTAPYDGYFIGYKTDQSLNIVHYLAGSPTYYPQSGWLDKVDGSAGSSFNWDLTKGTPFMVKYPYLGFGDIFFFVQNPSTGEWVQIKTIAYANTSAAVQLTNPNLQILGYTANSGNTTNKIMYAGSYAAFVSGERTFTGNPKGTRKSAKSGTTTETNLISIRNANSYNGVANRSPIRITELSFSSSAATGTATLYLKVGATLGGTPSYAAHNGSTADNGASITAGNSTASYDTAGTTVAGGTVIKSYTVDNPNSAIIDTHNDDIFIAPGEIMTFSGESSVSSEIGVSVDWAEDI